MKQQSTSIVSGGVSDKRFDFSEALSWVAAGAFAVPFTILLHELGHYLIGALFGFPDLVLHYGSVGSTASEAGFPVWQRGLQSAAGPFVSVLMTLLCCVYVACYGPKKLAVAVGMAAPSRFLVGVVFLGYSLVVMLMGGSIKGTNFDESNVALASKIPLEVFMIFEVLIMLGAWYYLGKAVKKREGLPALLLVCGGIVLGLALWLGVLGPLVLP